MSENCREKSGKHHGSVRENLVSIRVANNTFWAIGVFSRLLSSIV